ncbi:hypothetical protein ASZ90_003747 [hydrocarbon metagenome]|uniref:Uncharacterized protein n=1 Tax=hydrocarbon metagenome TaxID=938273 RepID=A0A0W8G062_9ZZZZ
MPLTPRLKYRPIKRGKDENQIHSVFHRRTHIYIASGDVRTTVFG